MKSSIHTRLYAGVLLAGLSGFLLRKIQWATAYDLELDAWREAGWRDVSYLVNQELFTGYSTNARGIAGAVSEYFQRLARSRILRRQSCRPWPFAAASLGHRDGHQPVVLHQRL